MLHASSDAGRLALSRKDSVAWQWLLQRRGTELLSNARKVLLDHLEFLRISFWFTGVTLLVALRSGAVALGALLHACACDVIRAFKAVSGALGDFSLGLCEACAWSINSIEPIGLYGLGRRNMRHLRKGFEGSAAAFQESEPTLLLVMLFLDLDERGALACTCRSAARVHLSPALWRRVVVPDHMPSLNSAIERIPRGVGTVPIAVRPGVYEEGIPRQLSLGALWRDRVRGVVVDRPVHIHPLDPSGGEVVVRSSEGDVFRVERGAEGTVIEGITIRARRFACHGVNVKAMGRVSLRRVDVSAAGMNGIGVIVRGEESAVELLSSKLHDCAGCGLMVGYEAGPVSVEHCEILKNGWSGIGMFAGSAASVRGGAIKSNRLYGVGMAQNASLELDEDTVMLDRNRCGDQHTYLSASANGYHIAGHHRFN